MLAVDQSRAGCTSGSRSGQASASAMGSRMSGGLAWAMVAPSTKVTIEWTIDCGCTTTSMSAYGTPKSRWASMSSRPLLTRVAELIVTTGPMSQVGCARASSTVTSARSSADRPRNGPPLAVSTSRATSPRAPPRRHCASAECSESTGTSCPGAAAAVTRSPPAISDSLLARATVRPAASAESVGTQADRAGDPVEDDVGGAGGELLGRPRAGQDLRQRVLALGPAALGRRGVEGQLQVLRRGGPGDGDRAHAEGERLLGEPGDVPSPGGQPGDPQPVGVLLGDRDRLPADGPGGAEHGDLAGGSHGRILPDRPRPAAPRYLARCSGRGPARMSAVSDTQRVNQPGREEAVVRADAHPVEHERPEEWGWHGETGKLGRIGAWIATLILLSFLIGNHEGRMEDLWLHRHRRGDGADPDLGHPPPEERLALPLSRRPTAQLTVTPIAVPIR